MNHDATGLSAALGARIRQARQERRWTLDQLADTAGVSRRVLVTMEQGGSNPSLGTLLRISDALGVGLPALVEPPQQPDAIQVTRAGKGAVLWSSDAGGRGVLLAGTEPPDVVELWDWALGPYERHVSEPHSVGTRELVLVQQGRVLIEVGDEPATILEVGDAAMFKGDVRHAYANPDAPPARFVLSVFQPGVGSVLGSKAHDG